MSKCFSLRLDGQRLSPQMIDSFKITVSMKSLLPIGEMVINDSGGNFLAALQARIGSILTVSLYEPLTSSDGSEPTLSTAVASKTRPIDMTQLVVCDVKASNSAAQDTMGGKVTLSLAHPWALFKDFSNHAYAPTSISNVIWTVVASKVRGYDIPIGVIEQTDDTARTPRYKCGLSDDEFIQQILLPFAASSARPMYSFVDDVGKYNLRTFEDIYSEEPIVAFVPNLMTWTQISDAYMSKNPTIKDTANYDELLLDIGGGNIRQMLASLSPKVFFEDTVSGSIKSGILRKTFTVNGKNYLPVNKALMDLGPISAGYMYQFRTMEDAVSLMYSSTRDLNELTSVGVRATFLGTEAPIGSSANLCVLATDTETKSAMHWMTGKFVVTDKTYYSEGEMMEAKVLTSLAKPVIETANSAIKDAVNLYRGYQE